MERTGKGVVRRLAGALIVSLLVFFAAEMCAQSVFRAEHQMSISGLKLGQAKQLVDAVRAEAEERLVPMPTIERIESDRPGGLHGVQVRWRATMIGFSKMESFLSSAVSDISLASIEFSRKPSRLAPVAAFLFAAFVLIGLMLRSEDRSSRVDGEMGSL